MAKKPVNSYLLRLPEPLREKLEQATHESGKTLRAEILERLERSFADHQPGQADADLADRVVDLEQRLAELGQTVEDLRAELRRR